MSIAYDAFRPEEAPLTTTDACDRWKLRCPECGSTAFALGFDLVCPAEGGRIESRGEVLPLLSEERRRTFAQFLDSYGRLRRVEGWGGDADYYRALPFLERTGTHRSVWRLRARNFRHFLSVLRSIEAGERGGACGRRALQVLELGAGNGWLSWRMATRGHHVLATDISLDEDDGLLAMDRYQRSCREIHDRVTRARADMESLPLDDSQFDLVVANASIHYAESPPRVLKESRRLMRRGGFLILLDSPAYDDPRVGRAMVERREREHRERYGINDDPRPVGFLVLSETVALLQELGFDVDVRLPFEGTRRALRRRYCRLRRLPPPARFPLFIAEKK